MSLSKYQAKKKLEEIKKRWERNFPKKKYTIRSTKEYVYLQETERDSCIPMKKGCIVAKEEIEHG